MRGSPFRETKERDYSASIALVSMQLLVRDIHLLVRAGIIPDSARVDEEFPGPASGEW
jgi:hypothetical protein